MEKYIYDNYYTLNGRAIQDSKVLIVANRFIAHFINHLRLIMSDDSYWQKN